MDRPLKIGRYRENALILRGEHVSRFHAEIYCEAERWFIRDCGTTNGTRLNGERIEQPTELSDGQEIGLGGTRLRIHLNGAPPIQDLPINPHWPTPSSALASDSATVLRADELSVLCNFMSLSVVEPSFEKVVRLALETVRHQTGATLAGFLSLDADNPVPKLVVPELSAVDFHLSRQLTFKALRDKEPVWLRADADDGDLESDSLLTLHDAFCLPLRCGEELFGALHIYKATTHFTDADFAFCRVLAGYLANSLQVHRTQRRLVAENKWLLEHTPAGERIIGDSLPMQKLQREIARIAKQPCSVLIAGESGAGKELVALALHRDSTRADGPLVTFNCAAIPASMPESILFGHCKGAFTNAIADRPGLFEEAHEGTLFLDEIGDLSLECQAKLLRSIETKCVRRVGGQEDIQADVRVIAATNRDLGQMVRDGMFRNDLYYRLTMHIAVPALRDHAEDIPALVTHFLGRLMHEYRRTVHLTDAALCRLCGYGWPGNVRQLRSVLENAVAMSESEVINAADLPLDVEPHCAAAADCPMSCRLEDVEAWAIRKVMRQSNWNITQAAKILDINRDTLAGKLRKYGIEKV
jgi:DNA-binding NtrC family response regulator/pSer/pThr/pTyr-binding forkhead associated (FHA) protein